MTALAAGRKPDTIPSPRAAHRYQKAIAAAQTIFNGAIVAMNAAGAWVEPDGTDPTLTCYGVAFLGDKDSQSTGEIFVDSGCFLFTSSALTEADEGKIVFASDDQTFSLTQGTRPVLGILVQVKSATSGYVLVDPFVNAALAAKLAGDAGVAMQKRTVTVAHGDLTAAALSQAINVGAALPANARIIGCNVKLATPFSGGGATAVSVDAGTAGDVDALVDGADLFAAAVDGQASTMPDGIAPHKHFAGASQLIATFRSDVNVADLTAGSCTVEVTFAVLA